MKKLLALVLCLALMATMFVGCKKEEEKVTETGPKEVHIEVSLATKASQWWTVYANMIESAIAAENAKGDYKIVYSIVHNDSAADQVASVETQIIKQPDIMLMAPVDTSTSVAAVDACHAAGIPVVTTARTSNSENVTAGKVFNEVQFAINQLEAINKDFPDGANVVYLFGPNEASYANTQYKEGFLANIDNYPNITLLDTFANKQDTQDIGVQLADDAILKYGDQIDAFASTNDGLAIGAVQAVKAAGYAGEISVYGSSALPQGMVAILEGNMAFTNMKSQAVMASEMIQLCLDVFEGNPYDNFGYVDPVVITRENVETVRDATFGGTIAEPALFDFSKYSN